MSLKKIITVSVYACMHTMWSMGGFHMQQCTFGNQSTILWSQVFLSTFTWFLGIQLRSPGLNKYFYPLTHHSPTSLPLLYPVSLYFFVLPSSPFASHLCDTLNPETPHAEHTLPLSYAPSPAFVLLVPGVSHDCAPTFNE